MEALPGYTIVEETDEYTIMEKRFGKDGSGCIRNRFPKNTDPVERQKAIDKAAMMLYEAGLRRMREEKAVQ